MCSTCKGLEARRRCCHQKGDVHGDRSSNSVKCCNFTPPIVAKCSRVFRLARWGGDPSLSYDHGARCWSSLFSRMGSASERLFAGEPRRLECNWYSVQYQILRQIRHTGMAILVRKFQPLLASACAAAAGRGSPGKPCSTIAPRSTRRHRRRWRRRARCDSALPQSSRTRVRNCACACAARMALQSCVSAALQQLLQRRAADPGAAVVAAVPPREPLAARTRSPCHDRRCG